MNALNTTALCTVLKVANVMLCLPHHDFLKNSQSGPKKIMKVSWEGLKKLLWWNKHTPEFKSQLCHPLAVWSRASVCDSLGFSFLLCPSLSWRWCSSDSCQQYGTCAGRSSIATHPFFPFWVGVTWRAGMWQREETQCGDESKGVWF